jgi:xanthine dehydrogenase small subunit
MRDFLLIYLNGRPMRVEGEAAFLTLTDFVRRRERLTGTKVVCAEGDCGACAVLVGRVVDGRLMYSSINACIQQMFQMDGAHVVTVEGLADGQALNPIQKSMVQCHGAQCGFCTPGFIVSLYDLMNDGRPIDANAVRRGLVGNLCRCTGYDSIIQAALQTDRAGLKTVDQLYPSTQMTAALAAANAEPVRIESGTLRFFKPVTVEQAVAFRKEHPGALIVSGATDLGVQRNKAIRQITVAMSTAGLSELRQISVSGGSMLVGAGATLMELEAACAKNLPELAEFLEWFGSTLIRNAGTLAGNLINASPIGDTLPALFVLNAQIELAGPSGRRWVNINEFYTGYRKTVLAADELVTAVRIPLPDTGEVFKLYKVSKRKDLDISSFSAAVWMRLAGRTIEDLRIAYGGVAATIVRLVKTEALLRGKTIDAALFESAGETAAQEVTPITDVRGSKEYRWILSRNILTRLWHGLGSHGGPAANANGNGDVNGSGPVHTAPPRQTIGVLEGAP